MSPKQNPQSVIDSYKKRQRMTPYIIGGAAALLVIIGLVLLVTSLLGGDRPAIALFASATPTATHTATVTPTVPSPTPTNTLTPTLTPTITLTSTLSGPFTYLVQEGDTCYDLAVEYNTTLAVLLAINNFEPGTCPIQPGNEILIPAPDQELPTPTAIPEGLRIDIEYRVQFGDTLANIASRFNSTVDAIIQMTNARLRPNPPLEEDSVIYDQQLLIVPVNLVTPTPTRPVPTTPSAATTEPAEAEATITPTP